MAISKKPCTNFSIQTELLKYAEIKKGTMSC
jgi:hypothetical protein